MHAASLQRLKQYQTFRAVVVIDVCKEALTRSQSQLSGDRLPEEGRETLIMFDFHDIPFRQMFLSEIADDLYRSGLNDDQVKDHIRWISCERRSEPNTQSGAYGEEYIQTALDMGRKRSGYQEKTHG